MEREMDMMVCADCGATVWVDSNYHYDPYDSRHDPYCGTCGSYNLEEPKYCMVCDEAFPRDMLDDCGCCAECTERLFNKYRENERVEFAAFVGAQEPNLVLVNGLVESILTEDEINEILLAEVKRRLYDHNSAMSENIGRYLDDNKDLAKAYSGMYYDIKRRGDKK